MWWARVSKYRRQFGLFGIAILALAAVLIALSGRLLLQERELAGKRATDQRRSAVEQVRRELSARLDAVRLEEINRVIQGSATWPANVIVSARIDGVQPMLPWQMASAPLSPAFSALIDQGEAAEFGRGRPDVAAGIYRNAIGHARTPAESAEARLRLGNSVAKSAKSGAAAEAADIYVELLNDASKVRDGEGVGYRFYAAERLSEMESYRDRVAEWVAKEVAETAGLTLPELYVLRTMPGSDGVEARIHELEQAVTLLNQFPRVRAQVEAGAAWIPLGSEPWLATVTNLQGGMPELMLIVSPRHLLPPGVTLAGQSSAGEPLGDTFPSVRVQLTGDFNEAASSRVPAALWLAVLAMVLGMAVLGGYLLLRDVNRDVQLADTRAQFVAGVSHELKTPLTSIRMFAETLALGRSRDERTSAEYLDTIVNESERLTRLVDNVLDFSKIEQGKKLYRPKRMYLPEVAAAAVRAMQFPIKQQGFDLRVSMQESLPEITADPDAIEQAILNLLTNAMKYSGDSRQIDLRVGERNGLAVVEVQDRGLGLTQDEQSHIFDKFYRAPSHASLLIAGTGLGLTLVSHIVQAHHGRVEVVSAPGEGSIFSIFLPLEALA